MDKDALHSMVVANRNEIATVRKEIEQLKAQVSEVAKSDVEIAVRKDFNHIHAINMSTCNYNWGEKKSTCMVDVHLILNSPSLVEQYSNLRHVKDGKSDLHMRVETGFGFAPSQQMHMLKEKLYKLDEQAELLQKLVRTT